MANTIILPFSEIQAELNDEAMIDPNAVIDITENGLYNVAKYGYANVNVEGGGGGETVLFDGNVTTEAQQIGEPTGTIEGLTEITADTIKVTFNGTEYTCEKVDDGYGDSTFTEYPFFIDSWQGSVLIHTQTAGTYTLKIEEPQSEGSSDFSTAEVTFICTGEPDINLAFINIQNDGIYNQINITQSTQTVTVPLYKNKLSCDIAPFFMSVTSTSGNITGSQMDGYIISGDCTINYTLPM